MSRSEVAVQLFREGRACSQAVFEAYAPALGLDPATAARIAAPFASGMRIRGACGAVTGAFMVLGLALGGEECVTREGRAEIAAAVTEFAERFRSCCGALNCPDVIGCDLLEPEQMALARREDRFSTRCAGAVQRAAQLLEEMLPGI